MLEVVWVGPASWLGVGVGAFMVLSVLALVAFPVMVWRSRSAMVEVLEAFGETVEQLEIGRGWAGIFTLAFTLRGRRAVLWMTDAYHKSGRQIGASSQFSVPVPGCPDLLVTSSPSEGVPPGTGDADFDERFLVDGDKATLGAFLRSQVRTTLLDLDEQGPGLKGGVTLRVRGERLEVVLERYNVLEDPAALRAFYERCVALDAALSRR